MPIQITTDALADQKTRLPTFRRPKCFDNAPGSCGLAKRRDRVWGRLSAAMRWFVLVARHHHGSRHRCALQSPAL